MLTVNFAVSTKKIVSLRNKKVRLTNLRVSLTN